LSWTIGADCAGGSLQHRQRVRGSTGGDRPLGAAPDAGRRTPARSCLRRLRWAAAPRRHAKIARMDIERINQIGTLLADLKNRTEQLRGYL
jgi:hypothetical protein